MYSCFWLLLCNVLYFITCKPLTFLTEQYCYSLFIHSSVNRQMISCNDSYQCVFLPVVFKNSICLISLPHILGVVFLSLTFLNLCGALFLEAFFKGDIISTQSPLCIKYHAVKRPENRLWNSAALRFVSLRSSL